MLHYNTFLILISAIFKILLLNANSPKLLRPPDTEGRARHCGSLSGIQRSAPWRSHSHSWQSLDKWPTDFMRLWPNYGSSDPVLLLTGSFAFFLESVFCLEVHITVWTKIWELKSDLEIKQHYDVYTVWMWSFKMMQYVTNQINVWQVTVTCLYKRLDFPCFYRNVWSSCYLKPIIYNKNVNKIRLDKIDMRNRSLVKVFCM